MDPTYFSTPAEFRQWLEANHLTAKELLVGYYKKDSGLPSMDWPQSVEQALCFGWIDGVRRSIDGSRYSIRFTPRKPNSIWSQVNLKKMDELEAAGLLAEAGRKIWKERNPKQQNKYSFEQEAHGLSDEFEGIFRSHTHAYTLWEKMAASYRKAAMWWVMSAKQPTTQRSRLETLIENSANNERIPPLRVRKGKP